ncbi:3'5'-cyclic-nucleotide phosphodiesterase 2 [Spathaspora sp. JA1]|nr:3'5'-cyclic-nucleotide phosphodiesterase 2 [Spathaspora sp. JA1]
MVEVLSLTAHPPRIPNTTKRKFFPRFKDLLCYLFQKSSGETDANHPIVVIIPHGDSKKPVSSSKLDGLCFEDKLLLLRYYFGHLNLLVCNETITAKHVEEPIEEVAQLMTNRISRVETWTGTGKHPINDKYNSSHNHIEHHSTPHDNLNNNIKMNNKSHIHNNTDDNEFHPPKVSGIIPTMTYILNNNSTKGEATIETLTFFKDLIIEEVDFLSLLSKSNPKHLAKLCFDVGNWQFPAHELTNDDLVYCAYLMLNYALQQVEPSIDNNLHIPDRNELLGLIFMVRDTYKNGNPFHNFRHAVDVVQACFHFLIRLDCLPEFSQLNIDHENNQNIDDIELSKTKRHLEILSSKANHLNPLQTLGLLTAALGHDVGHPGVTNAFMVKNSAPTSLIFNDRSVLESYHSSVFINKILAVNWNSLLSAKTDPNSGLTVRELIISSILATDMGEHFEYINKLRNLKSHDELINYNNKVKLISSLLIKCADISNVSRPLRVSAQWAMVLAREFEEVAILDAKLNEGKEIDINQDISYDSIPQDLQDILDVNPNLHKGQIFFINTFAENLFNSVAELLPEMKYACDIIQENKAFWMVRDKQIG